MTERTNRPEVEERFDCPECGAEVIDNGVSCPCCKKCGWEESETHYFIRHVYNSVDKDSIPKGG
jgi:ribosomal protein L37AE/L43A